MTQTQTEPTGPNRPRTPEGKARSSQNTFKHGLASGQLIIPGENAEDYESLLNGFLSDYQPTNNIETALVHEIAKSYWLKDRALRFQAIAFNITMPFLDKMAAPTDLGVLIRYQSANERGFYRALKTLQSIQKERKSAPKEFVSQKADSPAPAPEFVSQKVDKPVKTGTFDPQKLPSLAGVDRQIAMMEAALEESDRTGEDPFTIERRLAAKEV
jgi:hypothetical protein